MDPLPHHYTARAQAGAQGSGVTLASPGLDNLESAPPREFGGPGDHWSPETLLVAALCDCFVLGFRIVAQMSRFDWISLGCTGKGTVDRDDDKKMRFTAFELEAELVVPEGTPHDRAERLLEKAEKTCIVSQSLRVPVVLRCEVRS